MEIWKWSLDVVDDQTINVPKGAKILSIDTQYGIPRIWGLVDPIADKTPRKICIRGTGHFAGDVVGMHFVGTFQLYEGTFVGHVFCSAE